MKLSDLIQVTDEKGFVTLHEPDEDGNAGDLVFSVWRDDWLSVLRPTDTARAGDERCEHGVRHPHPCDDCLNRDIPRNRSLSEHPCYGLSPLRPTEFQHRSSWPLSQKDHPYCSRCGTEIEGVNNRQKDGAPLCWEPRPAATPSPVTDETLTDEVQRLIAIAYAAGCQAVHDNYQEDRDPDFSEAASDYARSIDLAALASTPQPAAAETVEQAVAAERDRCAKIADEMRERFGDPNGTKYQQGENDQAIRIAAVIRQSAKGGE